MANQSIDRQLRVDDSAFLLELLLYACSSEKKYSVERALRALELECEPDAQLQLPLGPGFNEYAVNEPYPNNDPLRYRLQAITAGVPPKEVRFAVSRARRIVREL